MPVSRPPLPWLVEIVLLALLYIGTGKLGFLVAAPPGNVTTVWFPSGLSLAALLLRGRRLWPGVWLGAFAVNAWFFYDTGGWSTAKLLVSGGIAAGSTFQALLGATLIMRWIGSTRPMNRVPDVFKFAVIEAVSCIVGPTVGVSSLMLAGVITAPEYWRTWSTWWLGDFMGVVVIAPACLVWGAREHHADPRRSAEWVTLMAVLCALAIVVFGDLIGPLRHPMAYALLPMVLWIGFRFSQRGVMIGTLLISGIAMWGTLNGLGPFANGTPQESFSLLQAFLGVVTLTGVLFAAGLTQQRDAEQRLAQSLRNMETLLKEVHHRVKNNLQIISSLLSLQAQTIKEPQVAAVLQESNHRILSMALVHERLYGGQDLSNVDMGEYLRDLAGRLVDSLGGAQRIDVQLLTEPVTLPADAAIPCGLILNELLSNVLKHAFPDRRGGCVVVVEILRDGSGGVRMAVRDNGVGLPEHVTPSTTTSLGLRLVDALARQLQATLEIERRGGTAFILRFSVPPAPTAPRETR